MSPWIEPPKPLDKDLYELPAVERVGIEVTPGSLREALRALAHDHEYLLRGDVFTKDLIETYIQPRTAPSRNLLGALSPFD